MNPYLWFIYIRNQLYQKKYFSTHQVSVPVISVGNLNMGGSGKTPFIRYLVEQILQSWPKKKITIISKSYKTNLSEPCEVTLNDLDKAALFGDEPCLLKSFLNHVDVWTGPVKYKTLLKAVQTKKYDLIIIDDGFSHLKIKRDLDIVLFDVSRNPSHYRLFPLGFMREPWEALNRSDLVVLTKLENQAPEKIEIFSDQIKRFQKNIIAAQFLVNTAGIKKDIFLFSGIGNPNALTQNLKQSGFNIIKSQLYPDHFDFPYSEQEKIWKEYSKSALALPMGLSLVTTQKDFIKLSHDQLKAQSQTLDMNINLTEPFRKILNEKINQLF